MGICTMICDQSHFAEERNFEVFQAQQSISQLYRVRRIWGSAAYTITPQGARRLLELILPLRNDSCRFGVPTGVGGHRHYRFDSRGIDMDIRPHPRARCPGPGGGAAGRCNALRQSRQHPRFRRSFGSCHPGGPRLRLAQRRAALLTSPAPAAPHPDFSLRSKSDLPGSVPHSSLAAAGVGAAADLIERCVPRLRNLLSMIILSRTNP